MTLPLDKTLKIGIQTIHRRTEPATAPWRPTIDEMASLVELVDRCGYDLLWVGDHLAFAVSILDPLLQLAQAAVISRRLTLGTNVYLLPLRHPGPVAKQVASLDHLCEGRLIFGVGVGGEFPQGVRRRRRAADRARRPAVGGDPAVARAVERRAGQLRRQVFRRVHRGRDATAGAAGGRTADLVRRPRRCRARPHRAARRWLDLLCRDARTSTAPRSPRSPKRPTAAGRTIEQFGTGHLLFARLDDSYETALDAAAKSLSQRYAMDFRRAAERYAALGAPEQVAERIREFLGRRRAPLVIDLVGPLRGAPAPDRGVSPTKVMPLLALHCADLRPQAFGSHDGRDARGPLNAADLTAPPCVQARRSRRPRSPNRAGSRRCARRSAAGGRCTWVGVPRKRGAGAGWAMPSITGKLSRWRLCSCAIASDILSTGAKQMSVCCMIATHSARVFCLKIARQAAPACRARSARSVCTGSVVAVEPGMLSAAARRIAARSSRSRRARRPWSRRHGSSARRRRCGCGRAFRSTRPRRARRTSSSSARPSPRPSSSRRPGPCRSPRALMMPASTPIARYSAPPPKSPTRFKRRHRRPAGLADRRQHARQRDVVDVVPGDMGDRPVLAPAGHPAVDQLRVARAGRYRGRGRAAP